MVERGGRRGAGNGQEEWADGSTRPAEEEPEPEADARPELRLGTMLQLEARQAGHDHDWRAYVAGRRCCRPARRCRSGCWPSRCRAASRRRPRSRPAGGSTRSCCGWSSGRPAPLPEGGGERDRPGWRHVELPIAGQLPERPGQPAGRADVRPDRGADRSAAAGLGRRAWLVAQLRPHARPRPLLARRRLAGRGAAPPSGGSPSAAEAPQPGYQASTVGWAPTCAPAWSGRSR